MSKPISPRLTALLQSGVPLYRADCFDFTLANGGGNLRYTSGDGDLTVNGKVFSAGVAEIGPYVGSGGKRARWGTGVQVDTLTFDIIPGTAQVLGQPFLQACKLGFFAGAIFKLWRVFMPTYGDTRRGPITIFYGRVAEISPLGRSKATFNVASHLEILDNPFPRNLFQAACVNNLGDTACGVSLASYKAACVTIAGSTAFILQANFTASPSGRYNQGKVVFTSGSLNGVTRTIKTATAGAPGTITLLSPLPFAPTAADTFDIYAGCDKTYAGANGCPKFSNQTRWRGEDLIPVAETAT